MVASMGFAQKDVTSQYITNATLSSLTGWTNKNFNNPVRGNNTVGYATECYEGWGSVEKSEYSLTQKITLPAGHYTLVNYSFYREGQNADTDASISRAYLKAGDNQVLVKTLGSITAAGYANSQAEGANCFDSKMYRNTVDFTIDTDNTEIEIGLYGTFNTSITKCWMICGQFELIDNDQAATMDSPFDVTGYITNPGFEYRDMSGWTLNGDFGTQNNNQSFKVGGYYAEKWQQSGALDARSMSQTLTNLPAGYYKLSVNMGGNGTYVDMNGNTANWTSDKDYIVGYVLAENEDLTITAGKTAEGTANWIHFDNFRLQFCGDVQAALTTLLEELPSYQGAIPTAAYNALATAVSAYDKPYSDINELLAAIAAIQELYADADLLKDPYATAKDLLATAAELATGYANLQNAVTQYTTALEYYTTVAQLNEFNSTLADINNKFSAWLDMKGMANVLVAVPNDNADANTIFANAIATREESVQNAEISPDGINAVVTATSDLKGDMTTYVSAANPVGDGSQFDCTFMLTNPDVTSFWTGEWNVRPAGWYTDQEGGNFQVMANEEMGPGGEVFMEYWSEYAKTSNFSLYQKVTLDKGTYKMTGRVGLNQDTGGNNANMSFSANETNGTKIAAGPLSDQEVEFVNKTDDTEVKIGIKAQAGNTYRWIGINNIKLYKIPAKTYTIDEDVDWIYSTSGAGNVTLNRNIKVGINTLVLPFSMTQAEVESTFGEDSKVYIVSSYDSKTDNITFDTQDGIEPNLPCLLKATVAGTSYEIEGRTIVSTENDAPEYTLDESVSMIGGYNAENEIAANDYNYVISGDKIYFADVALTMKGTRAYIKTASSNPGARELVMILDDEVTAISAIEAAEEDGVQKEGKFFEDGKIVIVKNGVKYSANGQLLK